MYYPDTATATVAVLVFLLGYLYMKSRPKYGRLPPGAPNIPIFGSLPFLGTDVREPLRLMAKKYGDVFTVYLGSHPTVILSSYETIKEALVQNAHAFSGRPKDLFFVKELANGMGTCTFNPFLFI